MRNDKTKQGLTAEQEASLASIFADIAKIKGLDNIELSQYLCENYAKEKVILPEGLDLMCAHYINQAMERNIDLADVDLGVIKHSLKIGFMYGFNTCSWMVNEGATND
jgi:hypothetical protein